MAAASPLLLHLLTALMAGTTAGLLLWGLLGKQSEQTGKLEQRLSNLGLRRSGLDTVDEEARAREAMQRALKELESLRKSEGRSALQALLNSSGTNRSVRRHVVVSALVSGLAFIVLSITVKNLILAAILALVAGTGLPVVHLRLLANRRKAIFAEDLPGAIDLIVRGIRAGLPLIDCMKMTATEWREPLRSEFLQVLNDMGVGLTIRSAVLRFAERINLQEARLFAIVIAIQSQSGGNLSEVLLNLADMLRERGKLIQKIRAMTSEARTSAWIIGTIPFLILGAVTILSPDYLIPLFETSLGKLILFGCGMWMGVGILVMRSMMRVDL